MKNIQNRIQVRHTPVLLLYLLSLTLIFALVACNSYAEELPTNLEKSPTNQVAYYLTNVDGSYYESKQTTDLMPDILVEPELATLLFSVPHSTIAIGEFHSLVIVNGSLWAWGFNWHGQLGNGTTESRSSPIQIGTDTDWASVVVGMGHTIALKTDGSLWAWGYNWHGQLGDGMTENRYSPVQVGIDTDWKNVFAGDNHTMAIKTDGTLWGWGRNSSGQLGDGTTEDRLMPTQIGTNTDWIRVMPDAIHTLALKNDGSLWFWGSDLRISFGSDPPHFTSPSPPVQIYNAPVQIGTYDDWIRMISERRWHSEFLIKDDGSLWARGNNSNGRLGDGTTIYRDTFVQIGTDTDWISVVTSGSRTVAIKTDGSVWSWGWAGRRHHSEEGEVFEVFLYLSLIGDGGNEDRHSPIKILPLP